MKISEIRRISYFDSRSLAIRENWFTKAENGEYERWLEWCSSAENITTITLYDLAEYAVDYSNISKYPSRKEAVKAFMEAIENSCTVHFEIEDYNRPLMH